MGQSNDVRLVELSFPVTLLVDVTVWAVWSVVAGAVAWALPLRLLEHDSPVTRLRSFEHGGRCYQYLGVRRWKDRLPDAGPLFPGGVSKRRLADRGTVGLRSLLAETRRGELAHWLVLAVTPTFVLWNDAVLSAAMVGYGVAANLPCVIVQRYNRARLVRLLDRLQSKGAHAATRHIDLGSSRERQERSSAAVP